MNKGRVEAFTDAIVAIIMTIMVLEFKVPDSYHLVDLIELIPSLLAYSISFTYMSIAWYNHHYMFSLANRITKRIFWANNLWLFTMSFIPFATAWAGRFTDKRVPEYLYFFVFFIWTLAYYFLSKMIIQELVNTNSHKADKIKSMKIYKFISGKFFWISNIIIGILIYYYPPVALIATILLLIYMGINTNSDSDNLAD